MDLKPFRRWFNQLFSFAGLVARSYFQDRCLRSAAALSYTTLLSLVPLTTVTISILSAFPVFESFAKELQTFLFKNFVPASGEVIQQHIEIFTQKTTKLTAIGISFLILSALLIMNTIEGTINDIWKTEQERRTLPKFIVYWTVLTLGPILIGASLAITSYLTSLPFWADTAFITNIKTEFLSILPFLATTLACTLLYSVVPNTPVPIKHAVVGALIAAVLFELSKQAFTLYLSYFPTYEIIYGALATIPIFLVWVYLSWAVVLLGAEISHCLANFKDHPPRTD